MTLNDLVHIPTVNRLAAARGRHGRLILDTEPDPQAISNFFDDLRHYSTNPLIDRLQFSPRDGTVAVQHAVPSSQKSPTSVPTEHVLINLLTITQDYTRRCRDTFADGWAQPVKVKAPHLIPIVRSLFDPLQTYLLNRIPSYLHQVRRDVHRRPDGHVDLVYTVEVAHRFSSTAELDVGSCDVTDWPHSRDFGRRRASVSEATAWALLNITPTDAALDAARLRVVRDAILCMAVGGVDFVCRQPSLGNISQLVRCRSAQYRDGRARYPLIRAVLTSNAVMSPGRLPMNPPLLACSHDGGAPVVLPNSVWDWPQILRSLIAFVVVPVFALAYLARLAHDRSADVDSVMSVCVGVAVAGAAILGPVTSWRRPITAHELYLATTNADDCVRIAAATSDVSRAFYNGDWLSFTGRRFVGQEEYPGRFCVSQLVQAGYATMFAWDGREVLRAPDGVTLLNLARLNASNRAVFRVADAAEVNGGVDGFRPVLGTWAADVGIGKERDIVLP